MAATTHTRKLAAIFYADVVGYSRLMGMDEDETHHQLCVSLDLMADRIRNAGGRVVHYAGDAVLASFDSVIAATNCAIGIQRTIAARCVEIPEDRRLLYRIGINLGEVILDRDDIYGDGVNVAARLEGLAEPGGICISASTYEQVRGKIDVQFEALGVQQLKNIEHPVQSYRVVASTGFSEFDESSADTIAALSSFSNLAAPATEKELQENIVRISAPNPPTIMILPFKNLSGDPNQEALVDGFRLSIQSMLVKLSGMFLVNAPALETYRQREVSSINAGNEVGVRFVLDGAAQIAGNRIRVTVQLTDAPAAQVVWSERYDGDIDDIFDLQDEITTEIAVALDAEVVSNKTAMTWWKNLPNRKSREYVLRGLSYLYKGDKQNNELARDMFRELEKILPGEAQGFALRSLTRWLEAFQGWSEDRTKSLERATELAEKAVELGDPDGFGYLVLGHVRLFQRRHDEALHLSNQSTARRLSCPLALGLSADVLRYCGRPDRAINEMKRAVRFERISPAWMANVLAHSYRDISEFSPSIAIANESLRLDHENLDAYAALCTAYRLSNSLEEARQAAQNILRIDPSFSIRQYVEAQPYKDGTIVETMTKSLRDAGLPNS